MAKIMIVEDDAACTKFLERLLASKGHKVMAFQSGHEAIENGPEFQPQILVTDWLLKDHLDGASVIQEMRGTLPQLPVIVVSGLPREDVMLALKQYDNTAVLEKPIDFDVLLNQLSTMGVEC